jgi:hypothetical protein
MLASLNRFGNTPAMSLAAKMPNLPAAPMRAVGVAPKEAAPGPANKKGPAEERAPAGPTVIGLKKSIG